MNKTMKDSITGYLFILPVGVIVVIIAIPLLQSIWMSFSDYYLLSGSSGHPFIGLRNYKEVIDQSHFWKMTKVTGYYVLFCVIGKMFMGLLVALVLDTKIKGIGVIRSLLPIPWAIPGIVVALLFTIALNPTYGIVNHVLKSMHVIEREILFLVDVNFALPTVICIGIWKNFPFVALMLLASLQGIPPELYEAARIDGANSIQKFLYITWPMIIPVWLIVLILQVIYTIKEFDLIYILTFGGPDLSTNVVGLDLYRNAFTFFKFGVAASEGVILLVIGFIITFIYYRIEIKGKD